MRIFDSHCHIDDRCFDNDFEAMLQRAHESDIKAMMVVGIDPNTVKKAITLTESHDGLFTSVGMHPHDAKHCNDGIIEEFKQLAHHPKVKAWGETGLDFNRMHSPRSDQEKWFIRQIEAADAVDLPMIFHERDSEGRFLEILRSTAHKKRQGVVHCFSGSKDEMFSYLDLGYHIGITGIITIQKRGRLLRELAPLIPDDRLLIETDAPYLTPAPMKNKVRRNEPAFVREVLLKLAEIKGMDVEILADTIWNNTCRLYRVDDAFGRVDGQSI